MKRKVFKILGIAVIAFAMACLVLFLFLYLLDKDSKEYVESLDNDDSGKTIVEVKQDTNDLIKQADEELEKENFGKLEVKTTFSEDDNIYYVFLCSPNSDFDLTVKNIWEEEQILPFVERAYNKVVDLFNDTGIGVYVTITDSKDNNLYGYNGLEITYFNDW